MLRGFLLANSSINIQKLINFSVSKRLCNSKTKVSYQKADDNIDEYADEYISVVQQKIKSNSEPLKLLVQKFKHCLFLSDADARKFINQHNNFRSIPITKISNSIEFLFEHGISAKSIIDNPWVLGVDNSKIKIPK